MYFYTYDIPPNVTNHNGNHVEHPQQTDFWTDVKIENASHYGNIYDPHVYEQVIMHQQAIHQSHQCQFFENL